MAPQSTTIVGAPVKSGIKTIQLVAELFVFHHDKFGIRLEQTALDSNDPSAHAAALTRFREQLFTIKPVGQWSHKMYTFAEIYAHESELFITKPININSRMISVFDHVVRSLEDVQLLFCCYTVDTTREGVVFVIKHLLGSAIMASKMEKVWTKADGADSGPIARVFIGRDCPSNFFVMRHNYLGAYNKPFLEMLRLLEPDAALSDPAVVADADADANANADADASPAATDDNVTSPGTHHPPGADALTSKEEGDTSPGPAVSGPEADDLSSRGKLQGPGARLPVSGQGTQSPGPRTNAKDCELFCELLLDCVKSKKLEHFDFLVKRIPPELNKDNLLVLFKNAVLHKYASPDPTCKYIKPYGNRQETGVLKNIINECDLALQQADPYTLLQMIRNVLVSQDTSSE